MTNLPAHVCASRYRTDRREYSVMKQGADTSPLIDNISASRRRDQKSRRCWTHAVRRRLPAEPGDGDGRIQERITSTKTGSVTSVQAITSPDDLTIPPPHHIRSPRCDHRAVSEH